VVSRKKYSSLSSLNPFRSSHSSFNLLAPSPVGLAPLSTSARFLSFQSLSVDLSATNCRYHLLALPTLLQSCCYSAAVCVQRTAFDSWASQSTTTCLIRFILLHPRHRQTCRPAPPPETAT